jgi:hypothetical protein
MIQAERVMLYQLTLWKICVRHLRKTFFGPFDLSKLFSSNLSKF